MVSKGIKKGFRILLYILAVLIVLPVSAYFSLQSPGVQTWLTNRIAGYFSNKWGTVVRIDGVDIEFFTKLVLKGVYVEDLHKDTLLYAEKLKADIGIFDRDSSTVFISDLILQNATVKLKKYNGDSVHNFQFIVDEFTSKDTTLPTDSTKWHIGIGGLTLDDIRFAYKIESDTSHLKGINFSDVLVSSVIGKVSDIKFDDDTIRCVVENFSLLEKSGFLLKEFYAKASVSPVDLKVDEFKAFTNNSQVIASIFFKYKTYDDFNDFVNKVKMKAQFKSSNIEMADIAYFSDELYGIKRRVFLNGDVSGKVSDLKGKNILLVIGDETSFMGNFDMTGLPDINQTFMSFDAKELRTSKKGIEQIPLPPFNENNSIVLPDNISLFGIIKFKGNFSGFYNDFVSYGKFNTALGQISTDISLKQDTSGKTSYRGKFATKDFNLGKFFDSEKYIGNITMNVNLEGKGLKKTEANLLVEGNVNSLEANGYTYQNINLKGKFARNIFDGTLAVNDENLHLDFNGDMDFSKSPTLINFTSDITKANLSKLNLLKSGEYAGITAKINANVVGNNMDDVVGKIKLNEVVYLHGKEVFDFKDMQLSIEENSGIKTMNLLSSIADAQLNGKFKPIEVATCLNDFLASYFPSKISRLETETKNSKYSKDHIQEFTFAVQLKNTKVLTTAFMTDIEISTPSAFSGKYDEGKNDFSFDGNFPAFSYRKYKFTNINMKGSSEGNQLSFKTFCQRLALADSVWVDNILISTVAARDTMNFNLNWNNNTSQQYIGNIPGFISFSEKSKVKFKLLPSFITIADSTWNLNTENEIVMDSTLIAVRNLGFSCGNQKVRLEGNISEVKEDQMYLLLSNFSLANFNSMLKGTGISVYGTISGNTSISNLYEKPVFGSSLDIKNLKMNKELIGDGNLVSVYESKKEMIHFNGGFQREDAGNIKLSGDYFPFRKDSSIFADADIRDFRLEFFEPFLKGTLENIKGSASAELKINGTPSQPLLSGVVKPKVDNAHVNYLGTNYHFDGEILIEPNSFDFSNLTIYDVNDNSADVVNGKIFHTNFRSFQLDFDMKMNKFLCLHTSEKDNSIYYGKFFATGIINVFGFFDNINLSATVKTDKAKNILGKNEYTQLSIPLSGSEEVGENSFISFVKNDTLQKAKPPKYKVNTTGFTMDFKLEPTPDAQVQLIFDEKVGDIIKANGNGNIEMVINEFGDFKMYGDYSVVDGDYLFTLKNVVNKKFRLENGGVIRWSGNPEQAELNMNAVYELRSSLTPLFHEHEQTDATRKRYPVDLVMNLSGKLLEPDINFDIRLPTVDDFTRQQAYDRFKNSEYEINKQVFSLMFTNSFTNPPDFDQGTSGGGPGQGTALTSTEMLSNQLSNWLSQISNQVDVGVHYRPGDEVNKNEVELALSTQLFNDKMTIDGSVANNTNTTNQNQNTANIVGDINVDYKLTDNGKFRAKAFNKANEGDIISNQKGPYTQGLGIFYREEFETWKELYRRFATKLKKKKN
ncbi:MAG: translocation/assembly module TamB domain-containing protein [Bacteroidetes bacterium]|nr:translocation/assembly module TamB domain-containing protein [Bacteroidota bacterium]